MYCTYICISLLTFFVNAETAVIQTERDGSILKVMINRPEKGNAVNAEIAQDLIEVFRNFEIEDSYKVAVLCGKGDFSAGYDLEGGVKGVRKPQNRTEKLTKTAIPHRILAKYRNRSYKCGVVLSSILEVRYSITNVILCIPITVYVVTKSFLLI